MKDLIIADKALVLEQDGHLWTTSLIVAEEFEKRHADVLRAIAALECSAGFTERNFALSDHVDSTGRSLPMYRMTRDGFMFLAMGFTGPKAAALKERFIAAFNERSRPKTMLEIMAMNVQILQDQAKQLAAVDMKIDRLDASTDAKFLAFERKFIAEKINQFPDGCEPLRRVAEIYFPDMAEAKVSKWLHAIDHPCQEYKYTDEAGNLHVVAVFRTEGLPMASGRLAREATLKSEAAKNWRYDHPSIGTFWIKKVSHRKNFMDLSVKS